MKLISCISTLTSVSLTLASVSLYAETPYSETEQIIDRACLKQAVTLVNELKSEIYVDMDSTKSNKILKLATATCKAQFNQTEMKQSVAAIEPAKDEQAEKEKSDRSIFDIFTEKAERKPGNERLRKHKK